MNYNLKIKIVQYWYSCTCISVFKKYILGDVGYCKSLSEVYVWYLIAEEHKLTAKGYVLNISHANKKNSQLSLYSEC